MKKLHELSVHPATDLFPLLDDDDLAVLAADIKANGLRQPVVLDTEGLILDGRNRLAACRLAGVGPEFVSYEGKEPEMYVISANVHRRHMTTGARAMATAMVLQSIGKRRNGRWARGSVPVTSGSGSNGWSQRMAEAGLVVDAADPELCRRVLSGEVTLDAALAVVKPKLMTTSRATTPAQPGPSRHQRTPASETATVDMEGVVENPEGAVGADGDGSSGNTREAEESSEKRRARRAPPAEQKRRRPHTGDTEQGRRERADLRRIRDDEGLLEIRPLLIAIEQLDEQLHNGRLMTLSGAPRRRLAEDVARFAVTLRWALDTLDGLETT
jgi:hypothetical protein